MAFPILLLPVAGWLAGKLLDHVFDNEDLNYAVNIEQFRVSSGGHGLALNIHFSGSGAATLDGAIFTTRARDANGYLKSNHEGFADADGDIVSSGQIMAKGSDGFASVYFPFCAFPNSNAIVTFEFVAFQSNGHPYPPLHIEAIQLEADKFARRNGMAAMCDAAMGAIRQSGVVQSEQVRAAKKAFTDVWLLDSYGLKDLRQHLRRATSSPLGSEWYIPERIAVDLRDELFTDDQLAALDMLYGIVGAAGSVGVEADNFLYRIAQHLEIEPGQIEGVRSKWCSDNLLETLGLSVGATIDEIRRAFRRIAKTCHPDAVRALDATAQAAATERFRRAKLAHDTLIDRSKSR